jgi:hypothetical protein
MLRETTQTSSLRPRGTGGRSRYATGSQNTHKNLGGLQYVLTINVALKARNMLSMVSSSTIVMPHIT